MTDGGDAIPLDPNRDTAMLRNTSNRRAAFTLVELMVSAAVCVLIMAILTQAFVISTDTMRQLKATGDMQDQLRAAAVVIRDDLQQNRFAPEDAKPNKGLKLSDQRLDQLFPSGTTVTGWTPPVGGFFRARCSPSFIEGYDNDGLASHRASGGQRTGHYLHFTSIRPGGREQDTYSATVPGVGTISSPAAEIAIFLDPTPAGNTGGMPYYNLVRRQRLVGLNILDAARLPRSDSSVVSIYTDNSSGAPIDRVNTLATITNPLVRLGGESAGLNSPLTSLSGDRNLSASPNRPGDDILLSFVTSFEVKLIWVAATAVGTRNGPRDPRGFVTNPIAPTTLNSANQLDTENTAGPGSQTTDSPYDTLPRDSTNSGFVGQFVFDTWTTSLAGWDANNPPTLPPGQAVNTANAIPLRLRVKGVKIVLRVWDPKLKLARQMTIIQDL